MEADQKRERPESSSTDAITAKRIRSDYDYETDDIAALLNTDEDSFTDLWKLLEEDTVFPAVPQTVYLPSDGYSYITINGSNDESCGSLFSERDSSVMASFDLGGIGVLCGGAWGDKVVDGCDCVDEYDLMLARFLSEEVYEKSNQ